MPDRKNDPRSLAMLIGSMVIYGTIGLFRRSIPLSSSLIALARGLIGSGFLMLWVRLRGGRIRSGMDRGTILRLAISGAVMGFNWIMLFEAYNYTTVSVATLCYYMQPTFVILLSSLLFRERMTIKKAVCALVALSGMVLISGVVESGLPTGSGLKGILLGLGAGALYATVVLINRTVRGVDAYEKAILQLMSATLVLIPYLLITGDYAVGTWSATAVMLLILVGIVHTGLAYALYFGCMDGLNTETVALFSYIDPVCALLLSALFLGERLTALGLLGAALILGSAISYSSGPR